MPYQGLSEDFIKALISDSLEKAQTGQWNITRHYLYSRLMGMLKPYDGSDKRCLSLSHSILLGSVLGLQSVVVNEANFPEHNMLSLDFPSESFDFCISDQVLEHVEGNPFKAFEESVRVVKKGGFIVHTTCFMNQIHGSPNDYWRFSPDALRLMAADCDLQIIDCGGWGNKDVWAYMDLGFRTARVPTDPSHPICRMAMENDDTIPIVTWVVAQKRGREPANSIQ
jgi:SAM-dependent methyltransferase